MNLPFYFTTTIKSHMSADEIKRFIHQHTITNEGETFKDKRVTVDNKHTYNETSKSYLYKAVITGNEFKMQRILTSSRRKEGNAFNPWCLGRINQLANSCEVQLTLRPLWFVLIFITVALLAFAEAFLAIVVASLNKDKYVDALITPFIFLVPGAVFWFFYRFGFKKEVYRTLDFLASMT